MSTRYTDLDVWKKAISLVTQIYGATRAFPIEERYSLASQLRRAASSIASNIAEGYGRFTRRDCASFLARARGSTYEVETQIVIARNLGYLPPREFESLLSQTHEIARMLNGLFKYFRTQSMTSRPRP